MALVAGNLLVSGSSFSALVTDLSSVEEERNLPVSGSSSFALIPGLALVEVGLLVSAAEKALVAGSLLVSGSSSPALVPGLASVEVYLLVSVAEKALVANNRLFERSIDLRFQEGPYSESIIIT